ncbi:MAG: cysteine--tRNA ligase [Acidimicrobiia bacterium]
MRVFNTLGRRLQTLEPREEGKISMYVCGATVQSEPHLGHGRYAVVFDVVRRYLEWQGFEVTYIRNITDVEDKIIQAARERGVDVSDLVPEMIRRWDEAYSALGVMPPTVEPKATDHIDGMIALISDLIERDLAYQANGDVYFAVREFEPYGRLSGQSLDDLISGARVEPGEHKRDPLDFALWKAAKPGEPQWDSPWGQGRPGWHIECSAMSLHYLGEGFDIHGGGSDLIFPHHENEIAQAEGAGSRFARYWLHNGLLSLSGEKMAKSTGVLIDLQTALHRYPAMGIRLFYLRAHYRTPLEFSEAQLEDAVAAYQRLWAFRRRVGDELSADSDTEALERFRAAMNDDFNTPEALSVLFDVVREGNRSLDAGQDADAWAATFDEVSGVLGLEPPIGRIEDIEDQLNELADEFGIASADPETVVEGLLTRREAARDEARFEESDELRSRLESLGIAVEDTPDGPRWHRR